MTLTKKIYVLIKYWGGMMRVGVSGDVISGSADGDNGGGFNASLVLL